MNCFQIIHFINAILLKDKVRSTDSVRIGQDKNPVTHINGLSILSILPNILRIYAFFSDAKISKKNESPPSLFGFLAVLRIFLENINKQINALQEEYGRLRKLIQDRRPYEKSVEREFVHCVVGDD